MELLPSSPAELHYRAVLAEVRLGLGVERTGRDGRSLFFSFLCSTERVEASELLPGEAQPGMGEKEEKVSSAGRACY